MTHPITRLNPPTLPDAGAIGYSQISIAKPGRMAYISGQVAARPDGRPAPESLPEQAKLVAANVRAALEAVAAHPSDIVMARIYVVDLTPERMAEAMPDLMSCFDGTKPSITGIGVAALAGPDLQIEMELIVRLSD